MKRQILMLAALSWSGAASAADSGHCDSKPFTLKKPVAAAPKSAPGPVAAPAPKPVKVAKAEKPKTPVIGCKQAKN